MTVSNDATHATFIAHELLDDPHGADADTLAEDDEPTGDGEAAADEDPTAQANPEVEPTPPGAHLASVLAEAVAAHGWRVAYRWTTPYGHAFDCERTGARYDVELRLLDAEAARWLVWAVPRTGLLRRLFKRPVADPAEHALLLTHLDEILGGDPRVSDLRWTREADAPTPAPAP